ncbi:MAG: hypothetical protein KIH02_03910, partial [Parabacteroides sp.]|nr:hypothetical protein [Parabacteroides sp.]
VVCLTKESTRIKTGKTTIEKRYFITSLPLDSEGILQAIRSHWSIENKLHWTSLLMKMISKRKVMPHRISL